MRQKVEICGVNTSKLPVLKENEKEELIRRVKEGDEEAKKQYIYGNLRLVLSVIQRFTGRGESPDDIFQVGCIGLIKAINNFDLDQNVKFSTYAVPMIIIYREIKGGMKMTRKQALLRAIQILKTQNESEEAIEISDKLAEMAKEIGTSTHQHWTKEKVLDSVEQYINEYGIPTAKAFDEENLLPSHSVIKKLFSVTAGEFVKQYFPSYVFYSKYSLKPKEQHLEDFKAEYIRLKAHGIADYNKRRSKSLPCARTVQSLFGDITSNELLKLAGFEIVSQNNHSKVKKISPENNLKGNYVVESNFEDFYKIKDIGYLTKLCNDLNSVITDVLSRQ